VFGYFSSQSLCYMRIRKRKRNHENLLTVGKRTSLPWYSTCMCLHHVYGIYSTCMSIPHICDSIPPLRVYTMSTCLHHVCVSTPPLRVYTTSICLPHPRVYSTSTCPFTYMSTPSPRVYPSFTYLIQFRTHGEFENENTFALASHCVSF